MGSSNKAIGQPVAPGVNQTFSCNKGYQLNANTSTTCEFGGMWSQAADPNCTGMYQWFGYVINPHKQLVIDEWIFNEDNRTVITSCVKLSINNQGTTSRP